MPWWAWVLVAVTGGIGLLFLGFWLAVQTIFSVEFIEDFMKKITG